MGNEPLFQGVKSGFEEEVPPAPVFIAGPVLVIVVAGQQKAFRMGHQTHGAPGGILEAGDAAFTAVAVVYVLESHISGKDSFYNYFETEDGPINVPVTFLCSGFGVVENPDHVIGSSLRRSNSLLYLIGHTEDEMGGSVFARTHGVEDGKVPQTDCAANMELYKAYYSALTSGLVLSAHDVSEGGLAVTAAEMAFSGKGGVRLDLTKVPTANGWKSPAVPLFSESTGRILVEVDPEFAADFETAMDGFPCACIGGVTEEKRLTATCCGGEKVLDCDIANLKKLWKDGLTPYY